MATDFTEETAADAVAESFAGTPDERLRTILTSLVRHLHGFVREVEPTIGEWEQAIDYPIPTDGPVGTLLHDTRDDPTGAARYGVTSPFRHANF